IVDRSRDESAASESQASMADIISSVMYAVISIDHEQRITLFNSAAARMFRYSAEEALGQQIGILLPPLSLQERQPHIQDFVKAAAPSSPMRSPGILKGLRADGQQFPIEASISQVEIQGAQIFTVIIRDISERQ